MADNANVIEVESDEALAAFVSEGRVLVDFYATWCGPCKRMAPELDRAAVELAAEGIKVAKADIEKVEGAVAALGIRGVPLLAVYQDGTVVKQKGGGQSAPQLVELAKG